MRVCTVASGIANDGGLEGAIIASVALMAVSARAVKRTEAVMAPEIVYTFHGLVIISIKHRIQLV